MFAVRIAPALQQKDRQRFAAGLKHTLAVALGAVALAGTPDITGASDCPAERQVRFPQASAPPLNIDKVKEALLAYQAKDYDGDVAAVFAAARPYVERRGGEVSKPALVLDIDETSLSNWANIKANNFGFIRDGACDRLPSGPCGFKAWILQAVAPVIMPALDLFNAAKAKGVAGVFLTRRGDNQRQGHVGEIHPARLRGKAQPLAPPDAHT